MSYTHRVAKFDPADREEHGRYAGRQEIVSDRGPLETAYLEAVALVAGELEVEELAVREPALFGGSVGQLFPDGLAGYYDGAQVSIPTALELVRMMLREEGASCVLEAEGRLTVRLGWDQYMYLTTASPCEGALGRVRALGLFTEPLAADPYDEPPEHDFQRPADDDFWNLLMRDVSAGRAGLMEELFVVNLARWHRLTPNGLESLRAGLAPRARLAIWPPLSADVEGVVAAISMDGLVECVWEAPDGSMHQAVADHEEREVVIKAMRRARAAACLPMYEDQRVPLMTAVVPDADGVLRARWQLNPSPADREWDSRRR